MKNLKLDEILNIFDKNTVLKSVAIIKDSLSGEVTARGRVIDVLPDLPGIVRVSLFVPRTEIRAFDVLADFQADQTDGNLQSCRKGEEVEVCGTLDYITPKNIVLKECRFL